MVMYMGKVVEYASKEQLFEKQYHPYSQALLSAIPLPELRPDKQRIVLSGEVSNPINPAPGCRFAPRCKYATAKCLGQDIPPCRSGEGPQGRLHALYLKNEYYTEEESYE